MQQKHMIARLGVGKLAVGLVVVLVLGFLMTANVPAPQHMVEKELDAKAFLESKPQ